MSILLDIVVINVNDEVSMFGKVHFPVTSTEISLERYNKWNDFY